MAWDPLRDLLTMQERFESLLGGTTPGWVPPVDLAERDDGYVLTLEVPGLRREDVSLDFADRTLVVRGRRPAETCCERYQQLERGQGQFTRSFVFAAPVDAGGIQADLADGILTIVIPKAAAGGRTIDVA